MWLLDIFIIFTPEFFTKCLFNMCELPFQILSPAVLWDWETLQDLFMKSVMDNLISSVKKSKKSDQQFQAFRVAFLLNFLTQWCFLREDFTESRKYSYLLVTITITSSHPQDQNPQNFWMNSYLNLTFQLLDSYLNLTFLFFRFCVI